jgi:hypothetical protein
MAVAGSPKFGTESIAGTDSCNNVLSTIVVAMTGFGSTGASNHVEYNSAYMVGLGTCN